MGENFQSDKMSGIYLHIPFCEKKCIYCDFFSVENTELMREFVEALILEMKIFTSNFLEAKDVRFETIYFGGGTPSLLKPSELEKILTATFENFQIASNPEITLETNPGTVDKKKLLDFRKLGVNRLSIGVQSFDDAELSFLGRIHNAREAVECVIDSFDAGFENVSIDLIFGLPEQTIEKWEKNLLKAIELGVPHISAYSLIVEKGTPLYELVSSGKVRVLSEEFNAELYEITMEILEDSGYKHYEVSNFARDGFECRHNLKYWLYENYIGFGPSAHSFWNDRRWWNVANLRKYIDAVKNGKLPIANFDILDNEKMVEEFIFLGLRSMGIDTKKFKERFGFEFFDDEIWDEVRFLVENGLMEISGSVIKLTRKGFTVCDEISLNLISKIKLVPK